MTLRTDAGWSRRGATGLAIVLAVGLGLSGAGRVAASPIASRDGDGLRGPDVVAQAPPTVGTARMLVILVRWGSVPLATDQPTARDFVFGPDARSVNSWYREVSYGLFEWSGDVTPVLTVADPGDDCHTSGTFDYYYRLANEADAAAQAAGYDVSDYPVRFIDFPDTGCIYHSLSQVGGPYVWSDDSLASLDDILQRFAAIHELGHALGLAHSNGRDCGTETLTTACLADSASLASYVYAYDAMGTNGPGIASNAVGWFSAEHLRALGWFGTGLGPRWVTPTTSGVYTLSPIEADATTRPQALVIDTPTQQYWVELRAPIGQDAYLVDWPEATGGVLISLRGTVAGSNGDRDPELLDMTPDSDITSQRADFLDAALDPGQSFTDPEGTFTITVGRVANERAQVALTFGGTDRDPPLMIAPPVPRLRTGRLGTGNVPVSVGWTAADPMGVCGSVLQERVDGAPFQPVPLSKPTATAVRRRVQVGSTYRYRVRVTDCLGNTSAWVRGAPVAARVIDDPDGSIDYSGTWTRQDMATAWGGDVTFTTEIGATAGFAATARDIGFVLVRGPARGDIQLVADGQVRGTIGLQADARITRSMVAHLGWSVRGVHSVQMTSAASENGALVELDAIVVLI